MSKRIPNLLHFLIFLALTFFSLLLSESLFLAFHHHQPFLEVLTNERLQILATILTYLITLAAAFAVFPILWNRPFLTGISWNLPAARPWFAGLGLFVGFLAQGASTLLPTPKTDLPVEALFHNPALIWILAAFGTLLAPLFEEVAFRGFLLPGIAILVDWLRLPRTLDAPAALDALEAWRASDTFTPAALLISSLLTSLFFALIHAPQLGYTWPAVALLVGVSLILCFIRIHTRSVAASTLIHAFYNLSVFITLFISTGGFRHLERA